MCLWVPAAKFWYCCSFGELGSFSSSGHKYLLLGSSWAVVFIFLSVGALLITVSRAHTEGTFLGLLHIKNFFHLTHSLQQVLKTQPWGFTPKEALKLRLSRKLEAPSGRGSFL